MAKVMPMRSLELDDEDQLDMAVPAALGSAKPRFPWGTRISLEDAQLKALGLDVADCCVGDMVHIHGLARITSVSQNDMGNGQNSRVEFQFEQMCCVENESTEDDEAEEVMNQASKRKRLYNGRA